MILSINPLSTLDVLVDELTTYLLDFYNKFIRPLSVNYGLPLQYFQQRFDKILTVNIRYFLEKIYFLRLEEMNQYYNGPNLSKTAAFYDSNFVDNVKSFFVTALDLDNITKTVNDLKKKFFDAINRLVTRDNTTETKIDPKTGIATTDKLTPFDVNAAINRVGLWAAYSTYNDALASKGQELGLPETEWVQFKTREDPRVDQDCAQFHNKLFKVTDSFLPKPPLHFNCRCILIPKKKPNNI